MKILMLHHLIQRREVRAKVKINHLGPIQLPQMQVVTPTPQRINLSTAATSTPTASLTEKETVNQALIAPEDQPRPPEKLIQLLITIQNSVTDKVLD